jgi:hypothetical protein
MSSKGSGHPLIERKELFDLLLEHLTKRLMSILAVLHKQGGVGRFNRNIEVNQWDDNSCSVQQSHLSLDRALPHWRGPHRKGTIWNEGAKQTTFP